MNIQQFQYILSLAEHRHFETAAEKCFISQSTLSTMISKFEQEVGITVFNRKKKPVEITIEGEVIIGRIRIIVNEINQLHESVLEIKGYKGGTIKIGCIPTVAPFLLPQFLPHFSKKYPQLFIEIKEKNTDEILRNLQSRDLDIGIISTPVNESNLNEIPLYKESFVLYDTSGQSKKKLAIQTMNIDNFWLLEEGHCMRNQVINFCERNKKRINPTLNINFKAGSIDSLIRFTQANNGKTLLPYSSTLNFKEKDKKLISSLHSPAPFREVGMIYHHHFAKVKMVSLLYHEIMNQMAPIFKTSASNLSPIKLSSSIHKGLNFRNSMKK